MKAPRTARIVSAAEFEGMNRTSISLFGDVFALGDGFAAVLEEWFITKESSIYRRRTVFHVSVTTRDGKLSDIKMQRSKLRWSDEKVEQWSSNSFGSSQQSIQLWKKRDGSCIVATCGDPQSCDRGPRRPLHYTIVSRPGASGSLSSLARPQPKNAVETHQSGVPLQLPQMILGKPAMTVQQSFFSSRKSAIPLDRGCAGTSSSTLSSANSSLAMSPQRRHTILHDNQPESESDDDEGSPNERMLTLYRHSSSMDLAARCKSVLVDDQLAAIESIISGPPRPLDLWKKEIEYFCFGGGRDM